jgi:hypothetical protein
LTSDAAAVAAERPAGDDNAIAAARLAESVPAARSANPAAIADVEMRTRSLPDRTIDL